MFCDSLNIHQIFQCSWDIQDRLHTSTYNSNRCSAKFSEVGADIESVFSVPVNPANATSHKNRDSTPGKKGKLDLSAVILQEYNH